VSQHQSGLFSKRLSMPEVAFSCTNLNRFCLYQSFQATHLSEIPVVSNQDPIFKPDCCVTCKRTRPQKKTKRQIRILEKESYHIPNPDFTLFSRICVSASKRRKKLPVDDVCRSSRFSAWHYILPDKDRTVLPPPKKKGKKN
jgi:hypothetical protein